MTKFTIKFARPQADTIESYGKDFNHLLDQFVGGAEQWDTKKSHGQARLRQSNIQVQRYETGPEIIALLISTSPAILKSIAVLITAWGAFRKKKIER